MTYITPERLREVLDTSGIGLAIGLEVNAFGLSSDLVLEAIVVSCLDQEVFDCMTALAEATTQATHDARVTDLQKAIDDYKRGAP